MGYADQLRAFYGRQNALLDRYEEVDALLESSYPSDVLNRLHGIAAGERAPLLHFPTTDKAEAHERMVNIALNVNLIINVLLLGAKGAAVVLSSSISLIASFVDSALDFLSSCIIWGASKVAGHRDPETRFKYPVGKRRFEPLGVVVFSVFMIGSFLQVLFESIQRLSKLGFTRGAPDGESAPALPPIGIAAMIITIGVKTIVWYWCSQIKSSGVRALAQDALNDVVFNVVSLIFPYLGQVFNIPQLDSIGGILLSLYIIFEWIDTLTENVSKLSGRVADREEMSMVLYCVTRFTPVLAVSYIECYHVGDNVIVEVDIVLPKNVSLPLAHDWGETIQYVIESLQNVERGFIHLDYSSDNPPGHRQQGAEAVARKQARMAPLAEVSAV